AEALGLPTPERRIGLSAHDFAQALGAPTLYLSRAVKVDGVPTVPSRWLQRLNALVEAASAMPTIPPHHPFPHWPRPPPPAPSCPHTLQSLSPPAKARPPHFSPPRKERRPPHPYNLSPRHVLKLEALKHLGEPPDNAMRGQIVHHALHEFALRHPDNLPDDIEAALIASADRHFSALGGSPRVEAFWRPGFARFAKWFAETEPARRSGVVRVAAEVDGDLALAVERGFRLSVRADRIDLCEDGSVVLYDYKTGKPPPPSQVDRLFAPQLPLEAAIVNGGGFAPLGAREVRGMHYIRASGRGDGGEEQPAAKAVPAGLAEKALADLIRLIERFDRAHMPSA